MIMTPRAHIRTHVVLPRLSRRIERFDRALAQTYPRTKMKVKMGNQDEHTKKPTAEIDIDSKISRETSLVRHPNSVHLTYASHFHDMNVVEGECNRMANDRSRVRMKPACFPTRQR